MRKRKKLKVGDVIIDFGQVCKIFKIKKEEKKNGRKEKTIFFKPYFTNSKNKTLIYSICKKDLKNTRIRKPVSKTQLSKLFKKLAQKKSKRKPFNPRRAKEVLNLNNLEKTAQILKSVWLEKKAQKKLTKTKRDILKLSTSRLVEEVAFVEKISVKKAKKKIEKILKNLDSDEDSSKKLSS